MKLKKWYKNSNISSRDLKHAFRNIPILERMKETSHVNGRTFVEERTSVLFLATQAKVDAWFKNVVSKWDVIFVVIFCKCFWRVWTSQWHCLVELLIPLSTRFIANFFRTAKSLSKSSYTILYQLIIKLWMFEGIKTNRIHEISEVYRSLYYLLGEICF